MELLNRYSKPVYQGERLRQLVEMVKKSANLQARKPAALPRACRLDRRLSAETITELVQAYQNGVGTPTLRRRYNLSQGSVLKLLREHGVEMRANGTNQHS